MAWVNLGNLRETKESALITGSSDDVDEVVPKKEFDSVNTKLNWYEKQLASSVATLDDYKLRLDLMTTAHTSAELRLIACHTDARNLERSIDKRFIRSKIKFWVSVVYGCLLTGAIIGFLRAH